MEYPRYEGLVLAPSVATVHTRCALMGPTVHNGVTSHYPLYHTVTEGPQDGHVTVSYMGMYCTYPSVVIYGTFSPSGYIPLGTL